MLPTRSGSLFAMAPRAKALGLRDPRVDVCFDRGDQYYEDDHPIEPPHTDIVPQDSGPDIFDIIREELEAKEIEQGKDFYIPRACLQEIFTHGRLLATIQQLWKHVPAKEHQRLCLRVLDEVRCWKVFLLFIYTQQHELLPELWKNESGNDSLRLSDRCLPLISVTPDGKIACQNKTHSHRLPGCDIKRFSGKDCKYMVSASYAFNAVYFKLPTKGQKNHVHYSLGPKDVLPYKIIPTRGRDCPLTNGRLIKHRPDMDQDEPDTDEDDNLHGGFGEVKRVIIDRSHFNFGQLGSDDGRNKEVTFALKRLHGSDKDAFDKELASLVTVKAQRDIHLIKLLVTFSVTEDDGSEVFYLLFPWAEGNLWKYWKAHEQERLSQARWMAQQCYQLARALLCVHNEREQTLQYYDVPAGKGELYGRHGDIKAENVLYFEADSTLVLSDFGLGRLHTKHSRSNSDPKLVEKSATYRAPEFDLANGRISRSSDVFSLGCMFLEFVTWYIMGYDAVYDGFPDHRMDLDTIWGFESDTFFKIEGDTAIIKPKVREWMDMLKKHEKASEYTNQFLDIIERMLSPHPKDRINVSRLSKELDLLRQTCERDPSYYGAESSSRS
ncbi:kinase-like domain-containing protein [Pseudoneurospora amorphoporcata]|uniref:Kinase-like domain-containing protein n=1 Tax=Pseudoneurospora amorphoporcata TaxID=241081 RepID=A0AAN6SEE2_9PEZI|nr:kinase-like domain-containing protein [Pseudoneurospora amorphoporcata]